jgi:hypothetical protein
MKHSDVASVLFLSSNLTPRAEKPLRQPSTWAGEFIETKKLILSQ